MEFKKVPTCDVYFQQGVATSGLERLWSLLEYPINIFYGMNGSGKTLLITALESYVSKLSKSVVSLSKDRSIVQKILNDQDIKNAEILLLDQPDVFLDFRNIKRLFSNLSGRYRDVKVVMTTNRLETILSSPKNIFYVQMGEPNHVTVSSCHPILARLRMTKGLREFKESYIQVDVYVESQDDVNFYLKIYQLLHRNREKLGELRVSDRYRPNFLCVSLGGGYGAQAAIKAISAYDSSDEERLMTQPFTILDNDLDRKHTLGKTLSQQEFDNSKLIFTRRYSLENYLYDPFIICSVMPLESLKMIGNRSVRSCLIKCKQAVEQYFQDSKSSQGKEAEIHKNIKEYFGIVCKSVALDKSQESCQTLTFSYVGESKKIECIYPKAFLVMRGHEIEKVFNSIDSTEQGLSQIKRDAKTFKPTLLNKIQSSDNVCVSNDLVEIFTELNRKIKLQINKFIKPAKYQEMILEERARDSKLSAYQTHA